MLKRPGAAYLQLAWKSPAACGEADEANKSKSILTRIEEAGGSTHACGNERRTNLRPNVTHAVARGKEK